jgi:uncharacterized membrane protein YoaK (UPF0700 family)
MGGEAYIERRLVALAAVAGCVDAASFLGLDTVFTANQTGNTVLLGIGLAQGDWDAALRSLAALLGFLVGVLVAALVLRRARPGWSETAVAIAAVQAIVLAALALLWGPASTLLLIVVAAAVMGAQSALTLHIGVPGVTTTFITGTITRVVSELAGAKRTYPEATPTLAWVAYLLGAMVGAALEKASGADLSIGFAAVVTGAVALSALDARRERSP